MNLPKLQISYCCFSNSNAARLLFCIPRKYVIFMSSPYWCYKSLHLYSHQSIFSVHLGPQNNSKSLNQNLAVERSVYPYEPPLSLRHSFNLLCSSEVHLHACLCKLQFLLNRTLNCRHMLEWSRCPSEAKWVTAAQHRLFWNQQQPCQAPTQSSPGCKPEPSPSHGHQHQMAEPVTELLEREKMASRNEKSREEMREKSEIEKRGWNAFVFSLIIRFLNSNGCGWICIA